MQLEVISPGSRGWIHRVDRIACLSESRKGIRKWRNVDQGPYLEPPFFYHFLTQQSRFASLEEAAKVSGYGKGVHLFAASVGATDNLRTDCAFDAA